MPDFPPFVLRVADCLRAQGFEAYVVGGCIRDLLLGVIPKDWDIATNATPMQMSDIFHKEALRILRIGEQFGTLSVVCDEGVVEVTTYRKEGEYDKCRFPREVWFVQDLKQDLSRRDFSMNALACDPFKREIIDYFDGLKHIEQKRIVCVGEAIERFGEDSLRILRAIRFAATKGFVIDESVQKGIATCAPLLAHLSSERIIKELNAWFLGDHASQILLEFGWILEGILRDAFISIDIDLTAFVWERTPKDLVSRLSVLLLFYPQASDLLRQLKYTSHDIKGVGAVLGHYHTIKDHSVTSLKHYLYDMGVETLGIILHIKIHEAMFQQDDKRVQYWQSAFKRYIYIIHSECYSLKQLHIGGKDLLTLGIPPKVIGKILEAILFEVFEGKLENHAESLLEFAKSLHAKEALFKSG